MIGHIISSILCIFVSIGILKSIEVREYYKDSWEPLSLKVWHIILICICSIIPGVDILLICGLIVFVVMCMKDPDHRIKSTNLINKINNFLNKSV